MKKYNFHKLRVVLLTFVIGVLSAFIINEVAAQTIRGDRVIIRRLLELSGNRVDSITIDCGVSDSSTTSLVTEAAVKCYVDSVFGAVVHPYDFNGTNTLGTDPLIGLKASAEFNVILGDNAGVDSIAGDRNLVIGVTGKALTTADDNILLGYAAGNSITTGSDNVVVGNNAGTRGEGGRTVVIGANASDTLGVDDVIIGYGAGAALSSTSGINVIIGSTAAGTSANQITNSVFVGRLAGENTQGSSNVVVGNEALSDGSGVSSNNVVIGTLSGLKMDDGLFNTYVGYATGEQGISGDYSTYVGGYAGEENTGSENIAIGYKAGESDNDASASQFILIGNFALDSATVMDSIIAIGHMAGDTNSYTRSILIGHSTSPNANDQIVLGTDHELQLSDYGLGNHLVDNEDSVAFVLVVDSTRNVVQEMPKDSLVDWLSIATGDYNFDASFNAFGNQPLVTLGAGADYNILLGSAIGNNTAVDDYNVLIGYDIGALLAGGAANIAIGYQAGEDVSDGDYNIMMGYQSGRNISTGTSNITLGYTAGGALTTGDGNILLGYNAGAALTTTSENVAIGRQSLQAAGAGSSSNTSIGYGSMERLNGDMDFNVAVGLYSGRGNAVAVSGVDSMTAVGYLAFGDATDLDGNIALGAKAGFSNAYGNVIIIGNRTEANANDQIVIGIDQEFRLSDYGDGNHLIDTDSIDAFIGFTDLDNTAYEMPKDSMLDWLGVSATQDYFIDSDSNAIGAWPIPVPSAGVSEGNVILGRTVGNTGMSGDDNFLAVTNAGRRLTSGGRNIMIGVNAGENVTEGIRNILMSVGAGGDLTTEDYNIAIGSNAQDQATGTTNTVAIGREAGSDVVNSDDWVAIGYEAAEEGIGARNVALGWQALWNSASDGADLIGIGSEAGEATTGDDNIMIGDRAGYVAAGSNIVAIGTNAADGTVTSDAIAIGNQAGGTNMGADAISIGYNAGQTIGNFSTAIGSTAGQTTGTQNVLIGNQAGNATSGTDYMVAIGYYAGKNASSADENVFIGNNAGLSVNGSFNVIIGPQAALDASATTIEYSVIIGYQSAYNQETTQYSTYVGERAGYTNTTGTHNTFIGANAGYHTTTGTYNISIGTNATFATDPTASFAINIGEYALRGAAVADSCIAVGMYAGNANTFPRAILLGHATEARDTAQVVIGTDHEIILSDYGAGNHLLESDSIDYLLGVGDFDSTNVVGEVAVDTALAWLGLDNAPTSCDDTVESEVSGTTTATLCSILPVDCSGGVVEVDVPAGATAGNWFAVSDSRESAGTNNITIDFTGASYNLHGSSQDFVINGDGDFARFTYVDATVGWIQSN